MKKSKGWAVSILGSAAFLLGACSSGNAAGPESVSESGQENVIVVGSQSSDAQIWEFIAESDAAKEAGLVIEVEDIDGGPQLNSATVDGSVDVNAFQSWAYLKSFNEESGSELTAIATTYLEPMGIYSEQHASLEDLPDGAVVAIADNPSNASRGLLLLQKAGLITLPEDFGALGTTKDITENPKQLEFVEIDDTTGPRVLADVDIALISNTIALEGGLNVLQDSLFYEEVGADTENNINILVTTPEQAEDPDLAKLGALYHSEEVQAYIEEQFAGTKVPVELEISELEAD